MSDAPSPLIHDFRAAMRRVASTVNVITVDAGGQPLGITATAMSSIAMDPPSLLVCINRAAYLHGFIEGASHFAVNVLHRDQQPIAAMFADRNQHSLRFLEGWSVEEGRPPRLVDAQASILCRMTERHSFGTHGIFIGVVEDVAVREDVAPLVYLDGSYCGARG
jgi:flavin reductase